MNDGESNAYGERRDESSAALLHSKHQDGNHQLGGQEHFHQEATACADTITDRVLGLERSWEYSRYQTRSRDAPEELGRDHADEADPVEGT